MQPRRNTRPSYARPSQRGCLLHAYAIRATWRRRPSTLRAGCVQWRQELLLDLADTAAIDRSQAPRTLRQTSRALEVQLRQEPRACQLIGTLVPGKRKRMAL